MRQRLLVLAVALGLGVVAGAQGARDAHLAGKTRCFHGDSVRVEIAEQGAADPESVAAALLEELERTFRLAGVKAERSDSCEKLTAFASVDVTRAGGNGSRAYSIDVDVTDFAAAGYSEWVDVWSSGYFGLSGESGVGLERFLVAAAGDGLDDLAAAWKTANP